jgi:PAS domain S-box-containing protein
MTPLELEQYQQLVDICPAMIWRAGHDGVRSYFNAAWLTFAGRSLEQEVGTGWLERIHPEDAATCLTRYRDGTARRQPFEIKYRLRSFDGTHRMVLDRAAPYNDVNGSFAGYVGSTSEVEESTLGNMSARANDFFEMSLDNLGVAGFDGYLKRLNASWTRTLGWSAEELMSRPSVEFVHPDDRDATLDARQRLKNGASMGPLINRYLCKDGSYRWFEWRSVADVERRLVYAAARDITEQKVAEQHLLQARELQEKLQRQLIFADRMASVGTLAAGVAHEINNPLSFVTANASMMVDRLETLHARGPSTATRELKEMATDVESGAQRIKKIVHGLKTFSRAEDERLSVIEVRPVLELAITMTSNEFRHRARLVTSYGNLPLVLADDARLGQVFINLLINAAQALPEGDSAANEIRVTTDVDARGCAVIEVSDTGAGIPAAMVDRIFDPFFTTKPVGIGTGLGLSICHNIVASMRGEISVTSVEGRGTTFRIVIPGAAAAPAIANAVATPLNQPASRVTVLVVDDEPAIGTVLCRVLSEHEVTAVTTARKALELLASGRNFDVVFSDLMMPEMSGMDFHDELTRRYPAVAQRVVFVSGGAFTPAAASFLERVANERIDKPFHPQRVRELVRRYARAAP